MTTAQMEAISRGGYSVADDGAPSPSHLRSIPMPTKMPKDALGQDIAFLLAKYPVFADNYGHPDLDRMSTSDKEEMLAEIKVSLGIRPIRTRHISYDCD